MATEHVTRFYSLALGREKNFNARTDGLIGITDGALDTTPDVSIYSLLYANTAGNATITYFDNGVEGQIVTVVNTNSGNIAFQGAQIHKSSSGGILNHEAIGFINHNSSWLELFRSNNAPTGVLNVNADTWTNSTSRGISVAGVSVITFKSTNAGEMCLQSLSGGVIGQRITILDKGGVLDILSGSGGTVGTFLNASARPLVMSNSSSVNATYDGTNWLIDGSLLSLI